MTHEGTNIASEEGTSDSCTKDCSSGTSASKNPTEVTNVKFDSVSDFNTESHIDHEEKQSSDKSIEINVPDEPSYTPPKVQKSSRSTKGILPTRYGSVTSHKVNVTSKFGRMLNSIAKKLTLYMTTYFIDTYYWHIYLCHSLLYLL